MGTFIDYPKSLGRCVPLQVHITIHKLVDQPLEVVILISNENILSLNKKCLFANEQEVSAVKLLSILTILLSVNTGVNDYLGFVSEKLLTLKCLLAVYQNHTRELQKNTDAKIPGPKFQFNWF